MYNNYYDNMGFTRRALWLSTTENYALKNRGDAHKKKIHNGKLFEMAV